MITYTYTKYIIHDDIATEIKLASLPDPVSIQSTNDQVSITFTNTLTYWQKYNLDAIINGYTYVAPDPDATIVPTMPPTKIIERWVHWDDNEYWRNKTSYIEVTSDTFTPQHSGLYLYSCSFSYHSTNVTHGPKVDLYYAYPNSTYNNIDEWTRLTYDGCIHTRHMIQLTAGIDYFFSMEFGATKNKKAVTVRNIMFELILYSS